jgi:hypothetical protein
LFAASIPLILFVRRPDELTAEVATAAAEAAH